MGLGGTANLSIIITAIDKASGTFKKMGKNLAATGAKMKSAGKGMTMGLTLPIIGVGIAAGKLSMDFEKSMGNISTLIDTTTENMGEMKDKVLDLSKKVPIALGDLTSALYDVRSAGISAEGAMGVLESSAKLATAGLGTTKEATDILTSAINAFGLEEKESEKIANTFFLAVKAGKTTVAELSQGFGQVAPIASELGVRFEELVANTAAMTTSGLKASIAYTQQKAVMSNLLKPTKEMQEAMEKTGITSMKSSIETDGFTGTLRKLYDAAEGDEQMIAKMFGSVEGLNAVMMLMGDTGTKATGIFDEMTGGVNALDEAFEKQKETVSAQAQVIKNKLNAALIVLGDKILPLIIPMIQKFIDFVMVLSDKFSKLSSTTQKIIIIIVGLVAALGPLLMVLGTILPALPMLGGAFMLLMGPIGIIIAIIGVLIATGILLYKHWDDIKWAAGAIWGAIVGKLKADIETIKNAFWGLINWFKELPSRIWEAIKSIPGKLREAFRMPEIKMPSLPSWLPSFQTGGIVPGVGAKLAVVHGGETIIPRGRGAGNINIYIQGGNYLDREAGEKFAEVLGKMLRRELRF